MSNVPNIINLTPHAIDIIDETTGIIIRRFPASGSVARCKEIRVPDGFIDGIPLSIVKYGEATDLPPQELSNGNRYIVSMLVAQACEHTRMDLMFVGPLVRDANGVIIGTTGLARFPDYYNTEYYDPK